MIPKKLVTKRNDKLMDYEAAKNANKSVSDVVIWGIADYKNQMVDLVIKSSLFYRCFFFDSLVVLWLWLDLLDFI